MRPRPVGRFFWTVSHSCERRDLISLQPGFTLSPRLHLQLHSHFVLQMGNLMVGLKWIKIHH